MLSLLDNFSLISLFLLNLFVFLGSKVIDFQRESVLFPVGGIIFEHNIFHHLL